MNASPAIATALSPAKTAARAQVFDENKTLRHLIWLYVILWLIEGGLRRWFLPGLNTPLLLIRDPLVIVIYAVAISRNLFPTNLFVTGGLLLAALTFFNALTLGHGNAMVALYGVRCDFLHVPLIFIMGKVLRRQDLIALCKLALWVAIPYTALLAAQFYEPQDAWVNRGVGGNTDGAGFYGAMDHFRPPGTFSFITGPSQLYPLLAACLFASLLNGRLPFFLVMASGAAILVAIPLSISRSFFLSVVVVAITGVGAMIVGGRLSLGLLVKVGLIALILPLAATQLPAFKDGMEAFSARWETSTTDEGGFKEAIVDRVLDSLFGSFENVNYTGLGTGFSTNVGQKLLTEQVGFGASEGEWGRLLFDDGFILGSLLIAYRVALAGSIVFASLRAWRRRSPEALIFASAAFMLLLNGQWGQATTLGSAVIAGGLALAAAANMRVKKSKSARKSASKLQGDPGHVPAK
ncbi:MAG: hypothetical protein P4N60_05565 [Verrucomicrobiae bacterium]|nr:hypothetical protein [Verrucomicrobiae bacterium]